MPVYVEKLIHYFQHNPPPKMQHQPHPYIPPSYKARTQYFIPLDDSKTLDKVGNKFIMQLTSTFLCYSRVVDGTILTALSAITSEKPAPTKRTMKKCKQLPDYKAT